MIARKIAYNVVVSTGAKALSTGLALVGIGLITRYLGAEGFGYYATILAFFAFFGAIADLGIYTIATREISRIGADVRTILSNAFTMRLTISFVVVFLSPLIALLLPYPEHVKMGILFAAVAFLFSSSYMVLNGVFQKHLAMDRVAIAETIGKAIQVGIILLVVRNDMGFTAAVLSLVGSTAFNFAAVFFLSRTYISFSLRWDPVYWQTFLRESLPMGVAAFVSFLYFKADTILLSFLRPGADVGIYNAAYKIIENLVFFPSMIIGLVLPLLARYIFVDPAMFQQIAHKTLKTFFIIVVPLVCGVFFLADDIIALIGGEGYAASAQVLRILIFSLAFIFFGHFFNHILLAGNLQRKLMALLVFAAILNIGANLLIIPHYSYTGAAIISVCTEIFVALGGGILVARTLGYIPRAPGLVRIAGAGAAMVAFLILAQNVSLPALIVGAALVYGVFLWLLRVVTTKELTEIFLRRGAAATASTDLP